MFACFEIDGEHKAVVGRKGDEKNIKIGQIGALAI
jgi:hypothetical protein